ncbi:Serine rich protein [Heracleum sosnowskyi]|uniref:Serine rich protein n=1 Tax=Heracleum sosnowskyi TaxID=360622 RepID=A0AAD8H8X9_9APIA|nr:Serine rich protein [Heracleum sosnowskyi]
MATYDDYTSQSSSSSQRAVAVVLSLVTAVVLSPFYMNSNNDNSRRTRNYDSKWSSGFVLPVLLAGLIVAIKTTTSKNNSASTSKPVHRQFTTDSGEASGSQTVGTGSSSWGLATVLVTLIFLLSWQNSVQHFFWR